jgi:pyruvate/2-oxoglutarate dehydrogenase complex dihydrolipoamide acyltransferase (E2) component
MDVNYHFKEIARSRIATFDIFSVGILRHHIQALLEFDVTDSRKKIREMRKHGQKVSFNGWLVHCIAGVLKNHPETAAYIYNKKKLIIFKDIHVAMLVEKDLGNNKVPIPMVIEKANGKTAQEITLEIEKAKSQSLGPEDIVLQKKAARMERIYYHMPGFIRRKFWQLLLKYPKSAFKKMGNVAITSVGTAGIINGWFIHKSVHPVSFGIGSILQKPIVKDKRIQIREILNMTILVDHDVIDGAPMVRLLDDLRKAVEND